jgi:hypothetical protein
MSGVRKVNSRAVVQGGTRLDLLRDCQGSAGQASEGWGQGAEFLPQRSSTRC